MTKLLKKEGFKWNPKAKEAFEQLKRALSDVPTIGLPDFSKPFTLETYDSNVGIGAILSQEGRPLAFLSQALAPRHQGLSIYENELMAILIAVEK